MGDAVFVLRWNKQQRLVFRLLLELSRLYQGSHVLSGFAVSFLFGRTQADVVIFPFAYFSESFLIILDGNPAVMCQIALPVTGIIAYCYKKLCLL